MWSSFSEAKVYQGRPYLRPRLRRIKGGWFTMSDMKIAVLGAAGRMGQALTRVLVETPGCVVAGALEPKGSPADRPGYRHARRPRSPRRRRDRRSLASLRPKWTACSISPRPPPRSLSPGSPPRPASSMSSARRASRDDDLDKLEAAARHAAIVKAGNMSMGVNLIAALTARVAASARARIRHRNPRDAPPSQA